MSSIPLAITHVLYHIMNVGRSGTIRSQKPSASGTYQNPGEVDYSHYWTQLLSHEDRQTSHSQLTKYPTEVALDNADIFLRTAVCYICEFGVIHLFLVEFTYIKSRCMQQ